MLRRSVLFAALFVSQSLAVLTASAAEYQTRMGELIVHHRAFSSASLSPEVAKTYGLTRGGNQGVVNIAVRDGGGIDAKSVAATLNGSVRNLLGQSTTLQFKEIREGTAVYYLASFRFDDKDTLNFDLQIQPAGANTPQTLKFMQQMYVQ